MDTALAILGMMNTALMILKQIPETSTMATEIMALETSLTGVVSAATAAKRQADQSVDASKLSTIDPLP